MSYVFDLDQLNEYQREAVLDESAACIVNANVGSGKTTVLTAKILYLHLIKGISFRDMVVLTFTNKAADEIRDRLNPGNERRQTEELTGFGTFHSVALHLLRYRLPVEKLSYTKDFQVVDPDEELDMALQLIQENGLKIKYRNRLKKRLEQVMPLKAGKKDEDKCLRIAAKYKDDFPVLTGLLQTEKIRQNKMSFSDLLIYAAALLEGAESIWPAWIIIDEVQDSDSLQLELTDRLKGPQTRLFAVGDPNQVIYSWRGSELNVFYTLRSRYGARELSLPVNYRSCAAILDVARVFQQNGSALIGSREGRGTITLKRQYDPFTEACYLAERIRELHAGGLAYGETAVFYRLQSQAAILEDVFSREGIPCEISVKKTLQEVPVLAWSNGAPIWNNDLGGSGGEKSSGSVEGTSPDHRDTVKLMTLHASKGLEFTQVFLIGVNNGLIPLQSGPDEEEEERRLFFVGMTRARDALELSYYTNPGYAKVTEGESRFLKMIPERLLPREDVREDISNLQKLRKEILRSRQQEAVTQTEDTIIPKAECASACKQLSPAVTLQSAAEGSGSGRTDTMPGHLVRHPKYGTGHILQEDESMLRAEFHGYGEKEFIKAFMELEYL